MRSRLDIARTARRHGADARAGRLAAALALALVVGVSPASAAARKSAGPPAVYVFPSPGARVASPQTQITFRGLPIDRLGQITVIGARSGTHSGRLVADSDDQGGSFIPTAPFATGERVTVRAGVTIVGGRGTSYQFITAKPAPALAPGALFNAHRIRGDVEYVQSRPDLQPVNVQILTPDATAQPQDVFLAPQTGPLQNGPMILSPTGQLVWYKPVPAGQFATDFREQSLFGQNVLTWWQGTISGGVGNGEDLVYNTNYRQAYAVHAGNGLPTDLHEFQLTSRGTALVTAYYPVYWDASSVHRSSNAVVLDAAVQEVDIKTGLVLFQWDSLDHVPLSASYAVPPSSATAPYDYFHVNSIQQDPSDGNLVISSRHAWAAYKVSHQTGALIWILGGRQSSFTMGPGAQFAWQHDVRLHSRGVVTIFDDGAGDVVTHKQSRALTLVLNYVRRTATVAASYQHTPGVLAFYEGNVQALAGGDYVVGWGQAPYFTEFDPSGKVVFDGRFVDANSTYRAYRFAWAGTPATLPAVAAHTNGHINAVYASWDGDAAVVAWRILGGRSATALAPVATVSRRGFETRTVISPQPYVAVQGLDGAGRVLGQSHTVTPR